MFDYQIESITRFKDNKLKIIATKIVNKLK